MIVRPSDENKEENDKFQKMNKVIGKEKLEEMMLHKMRKDEEGVFGEQSGVASGGCKCKDCKCDDEEIGNEKCLKNGVC
ncbi:unnamed protein product [Caenorhabditis brenneri]